MHDLVPSRLRHSENVRCQLRPSVPSCSEISPHVSRPAVLPSESVDTPRLITPMRSTSAPRAPRGARKSKSIDDRPRSCLETEYRTQTSLAAARFQLRHPAQMHYHAMQSIGLGSAQPVAGRAGCGVDSDLPAR